ncbi:MAG: hypothetical protein H7329_04095 [Opitutaceae bacterium]|nr:hypothetical protein [Cytophagales bacterium]
MEQISTCPVSLDEKHAIAILYYLIADADFNISESESALIDKKIEDLFADADMDYYEKRDLVGKIIDYSIGLNDNLKKETVKYLSERVKFTHEQYIKLIQDLDDIARCDNYISIEEHSLMFYIRLKFKKNYARAEQYDILTNRDLFDINEGVLNIDGLAA